MGWTRQTERHCRDLLRQEVGIELWKGLSCPEIPFSGFQVGEAGKGRSLPLNGTQPMFSFKVLT